ncbi:alkaline-phosphatase-like protein [Xylariomycetidae sp. FL0641]|nr:alkaline-phosphatase-like protein [Xylariomycetidae sp. FL0641]
MAPHKNIVLLIADDMGREQMSCYGSTALSTPRLDELAKSGSMFDLAFASTASCSGSRTTIYTGLHTHNNGNYGLTHERNGFQTHADIETLPEVFNALGYATGILGKVHVGPAAKYPWQTRAESETRNVAAVADQAAAFMRAARDGDRPFFLTVGYVDPHRAMGTRAGFGNVEGNHDARLADRVFAPDRVAVPSFLPDLPGVRAELAEYYRAIHRLDQGVGRVLDAVAAQEEGGAADTMVVFLSDNGPPFLNSKTTLYDAGVRLPLLVRVPGRAAGVTSPNMVSWTDLLPTFLDWAGAGGRQPGPGMYGPRRGRSFLPILDTPDPLPGWDVVCGSHTFHEVTNYWPTRYLRTRAGWKYHRNVCWRLDFPFATDLYASLSFEGIRNADPPMLGERKLKDYIFRPPEELYDLGADPNEVRNLAADPAHRDTLLALRARLERWQDDTEDIWLWRDGVSLWRYRMHGYHREGLRIPDRFDFDPERPGNRDAEVGFAELDPAKVQQTAYGERG